MSDMTCPGCGVPRPQCLRGCTHHDEIESLRAEIARLREERRWISVGERLPPTDAEVLFDCGIDGDFIGVHLGTSTGRMNDYGTAVIMDIDGDCDWVPCTHWMPLPPGPEGEG